MFSILDDTKTFLEQQAARVRKALDEYHKKPLAEKAALKERIGKDLEKMKSQLQIFRVNLSLVREPENLPYKAVVGKMTQELYSLFGQYKSLEPLPSERETLPTDRAIEMSSSLFGKAEQREKAEAEKERELVALPVQKVIGIGDKYQEETLKVAGRTGRKLKETLHVADEIIIEEDKISQQLRYIDNRLSQADSTMNRITRYTRYFSRNYMTDRCIIAGIIVITVFLVIILIMQALFPAELNKVVDKVKSQ